MYRIYCVHPNTINHIDGVLVQNAHLALGRSRVRALIFRKDDVHFKLLAHLNNSPQERRVAPLGYIILIPSQQVLVFYQCH
jgi:hypothetical protein